MEPKDIVIRITGTQTGENGDSEEMDFITEGKLYRRNGFFYAIYEETLISGDPSYKTTLKYSDKLLKMKRSTADEPRYTVIEFAPDGQFSGMYQTPFGPLEMDVKTNVYEQNLNEEGLGSVFVDYKIALKGFLNIDNRIVLQFAKSASELKKPKLS